MESHNELYPDSYYDVIKLEGVAAERAALEWLDPKIGDRILDIGCGRGRFMEAIEKTGAEVVGIEAYAFPLEQARKRVRGELHLMSAEDMLFPDASFDKIFCFPAGTMIDTGSSVKTIESIQVGEEIASLTATRVVKTFKRNYQGDFINIKVQGLPIIRITPEHAILVTNLRRIHRKSRPKHIYEWIRAEPQWRKAKDITKDDWVIVPREKANESYCVELRRGRKGLGCKRSYGRNGIDSTAWKDNRQAHKIEIDYDAAWIFGLWVAEGHLRSEKSLYRLTFSLGIHEKALADRLVHRLKNTLGLNSWFHEVPEQNGLRVYVCNKDLVSFIQKNFGKLAHGKHIPEWLMKAPEQTIRGFIDGFYDGDGSLNGSVMTLTTVSTELAYGLLFLTYKVGTPAWLQYIPKVRGEISVRPINGGPAWNVNLSKRAWCGEADKLGRGQGPRTKVDQNCVYLPVKNVEVSKAEKSEVFNLQTESGTYRVPFLVHNCYHVIEHLDRPALAFAEMHRILKKKSRLLLSFPNSNYLPFRLGLLKQSPQHLQRFTSSFKPPRFTILKKQVFRLGFNVVMLLERDS